MSDPPHQSPAGAARYVILTPCRDEGHVLPATIRTVTEQTVLPARWVIVDDGSRDNSPWLLEQAAARWQFIQVVRRPDRGKREVGAGVIDAFYAGLETVDLDQYGFLCKLDADIEVPPRYFERLLELMHACPRLGTVSGKVFCRAPGGRLLPEERGDENSVGPSKFYRTECFCDIGGFVRSVGWDGVDGHLCRMHGWIARSLDGDGLRLVHQRRMGSSDRSILIGRARGGRGKWFIGNSPLYVLATALYRLKDRPYIIGSLCMLWGYFDAMRRRHPRFGDHEYRRYLRRFEWECLLRGKRRTTEGWIRRVEAAAPARGER